MASGKAVKNHSGKEFLQDISSREKIDGLYECVRVLVADRRRRRRRRRDPPAGGRARPRRAAVPGRADRSRRAARPARPSSTTTARRAIPAATPTTSSTTSARPASARSPAGAARTASSYGKGAPNPNQLDALHRQRLLLASTTCAGASATTSTPTRPISNGPTRMGFIDERRADRACSSMSSRCRNSASPAQGHGAVHAARERIARGSRPISTRCRSGIRRSRSAASTRRLPAARDHAAADARCTTRGARRTPGCARSTARTGST